MNTRFNLNHKVTLFAWSCLISLLSSCATSVDLSQEGFQESATPKALLQNTSLAQDKQVYAFKSKSPLTPSESSADRDQLLAWNASPKNEWWNAFQSASLDQLVKQALTHNPNLTAARSTLAQAQANALATYGSLAYPNVNGQVGVNRQRASQATTNVPGGSIFNLYNTSVNVSYTLDLMGANQFTIASAQAQAQFQTYQWRAAELSLTGNVITAAIREAQLSQQIQQTQVILKAQEKQLQIMENQLKLGAINSSAVLAQASLVAQTRSGLPTLQKSLEQAHHQIAILCGEFPAQSNWTGLSLNQLSIPKELPVSLPSELLHH